MSGGESPIRGDILKSRSKMDSYKSAGTPTDGESIEPEPDLIFNPTDLIGRSFLMNKQEDGQQFRGRIFELLEDHESKVDDNPTRIKFRVSVN
jgi:hypothetical protein